MDLDVNSLGSTVFGGALCLALARAYVAKMIRTVEALDKTVQALETALSVIHVRVDEIKYIKKTLQEHDRQLATLSAKVGVKTKSRTDDE